MDELKAAHGIAVETHVALLLDARERSDVLDLCVQRHLQIMKHCSRGHHTILEVVDTETLEVLYLKVLDKFLACKRVGELPQLLLFS